MTKRILFVDDQPNVLAGLRRTLHSCAEEWEMEFVTSGPEALARMASRPFDIIVSDMCMPFMDGAQLLNEVRLRWADTVRIILSGQADETLIRRSVGQAHQYLTKPCDPTMLRNTLRRAFALRDQLSNPEMRRIASQITTVPSLPAAYRRLFEELHQSEPSLASVRDIVFHDVGMTAKLLQLTSSSFFGHPRQARDVDDAIRFLGLGVLQSLVLTTGIFSQFDRDPPPEFSLAEFTAHGISVGLTAKRWATLRGCAETVADNALTAGVLHDVGRLILAYNAPHEYSRAMQVARERSLPLYRAEREVLGVTHADVGGYLLGLWGLPNDVVEAVMFHHDPSQCLSPECAVLTAVHVADGLVHQVRADPSCPFVELNDEYLTHLGISEPLEQWSDLVVLEEPVEILR